ncbi:MAG: O-antigen ligase family protein [Patescibacteria group bacterium]|nr:O-antigen ligase family protein [Patescibacteria group bacterium]
MIKNKLQNLSKPLIYTTLCFFYVSIFILPSFFIPFNIYLYLFGIGFASLFILKVPEVGLYTIVLCTMIYERFFTLQPIILDVNIYKIYPIDVLLAVTFISFLIHHFGNLGSKEIKYTRLEKATFIFFLTLIVALVYSIIKNPDKELALATFKNYSYLLILFLTIFIIRTKVQFKRIIKVFLAGGIILIGFIIYGLATGNGLWSEFTPGTRFLAQTHTYYLLLPVFIAIVFLTYGKEIYGHIKTQAIILVQSVGIVAGMHRHLWLGFLSGLATIFLLSNKEKRKVALKNILGILLVVLIVFSIVIWITAMLNTDINIKASSYTQRFIERVQSLFTLKSSNIEEAAGWRLKAWQEGLVQYSKNPILGIGFGKMLNVEFKGFVSTVEMRALHNELLGVLIQTGIIGLIPFLFINYYLIKYFIKLYKAKISEQPELIALFAFYVATCVGLLFSLYLVTNMLNIFYWIAMGLIVSLYKMYKLDQIK